MILIIDICKEPLHFYEFVKPVVDIASSAGKEALIVNYKDLSSEDLKKSIQVVICGTSLKDDKFLKDVSEFEWLKSHRKPVLGICGGAHIIGLILGGKLKSKKEIGLKEINIKKKFLGHGGKREVYYLHKFYVLPETYQKGNFYATLFHPEVRNREMIENFLNLDL